MGQAGVHMRCPYCRHNVRQVREIVNLPETTEDVPSEFDRICEKCAIALKVEVI